MNVNIVVVAVCEQALVRQEACQALYRLCLGKTADGKTGYRYLLPTLAGLVSFLHDAQAIKSPARKVQCP